MQKLYITFLNSSRVMSCHCTNCHSSPDYRPGRKRITHPHITKQPAVKICNKVSRTVDYLIEYSFTATMTCWAKMPFEIKSLILDLMITNILAFKSSVTPDETLESPENTPERRMTILADVFPDLLDEILRLLEQRLPGTEVHFVNGLPEIISPPMSTEVWRVWTLRLLVLLHMLSKNRERLDKLEELQLEKSKQAAIGPKVVG